MSLGEVSTELGSDEGGFGVQGFLPLIDNPADLPENTLARWQLEFDIPSLRVSSGSQWGPFTVTLRVCEQAPVEVGEEWEDVVEVAVRLVGPLTVFEIVDGPVAELEAVAGDYRLRLAARGRTESAARDNAFYDEDEDEDQSALEHFLIELWPSAPAPAAVVRETSQRARDLVDPPVVERSPDEKAALEAARRMYRDFKGQPGARPLDGPRGALEVELELTGTPVKVFNRLRDAGGWPFASGAMGSPDLRAYLYLDVTDPDVEYDFDIAGCVRTALVDEAKPQHLTKAWNWVPRGSGTLDSWTDLFNPDGTVTITLVRTGEDRVSVRLVHDGVPDAWHDDQTALWVHEISWRASR